MAGDGLANRLHSPCSRRHYYIDIVKVPAVKLFIFVANCCNYLILANFNIVCDALVNCITTRTVLIRVLCFT